ncbi:MAG TPA: zinc-binding dehydrogenase [Pseudonocardiaceae bacterium]|jgi:NADPH2:quinone reductase|nr:zinc-binding dehydrogenase [Pseudonocardiaceae bacterium]
MRAVQVSQFGGPEVLVPVTLPGPVASAGQTLVQVAAADVLYLDTQLRSGRWRDYFPLPLPYIPGGAVAGVADGEVVVGRTVDGRGGYADQALVSGVVAVPDGVGVREAAAMAHDGPTALALFEGASILEGERVLVTGAAGGLGSLLVRLSRAAGARVVGAASKAKLDLVEEIGADVAVDYGADGWAQEVGSVDVVFDGVGGAVGAAAFEVTVDGGRFSAHGAPGGGFAAVGGRGITVKGIEQVQFSPEQAAPLLTRALAELAAGRLIPLVGQTFPFERAADAHVAIESRNTVGKTLLTM